MAILTDDPFQRFKGMEEATSIQRELAERLKYKPRSELSFAMSHNNIVCCFLGKRLYITDSNLLPLLYYESTSYLDACTISDNGKYALCLAAYNGQNDEDSGAAVLFQVVGGRKLLAKKPLKTGWKGVTHLFIDETKQIVWVYYNSKKVSYNFGLDLVEAGENMQPQKTSGASNEPPDEEFAQFVENCCDKFSTEASKKEFRRIADERRNKYKRSCDDDFTLEELLMLDLESMLKAEKYYNS